MKNLLTHVLGIYLLIGATQQALAEPKTCDKRQSFCLVNRGDLTIGDRVGFFHREKLAAIGRVSDILYDGKRRIEIVDRYATIYASTKIKFIDDDLGISDNSYGSKKYNQSDRQAVRQYVTKHYQIVPKLKKFSASVVGGVSSFQLSDGLNGFEAMAKGEQRIWKGLKVGGNILVGKGSGDINRLNLDADGYNWGYMDVNYFGVYPAASYTVFETRAVGFKFDASYGLNYVSGEIDEDADLFEDKDFDTKMKNGFGQGGRIGASLLVDVSIANLEIYVAGNLIHDTTYASIGLGLAKDF
ncbi:MAG: hypothetical protein KBD78_02725 [Oligoflexales bacterium]|nr:hypothetical protein [Oligoflexales bacterium]